MKKLIEKSKIVEFQNELIALLDKHKCYLYAEDGYGAELLAIKAFSSGRFDIELFNEDGNVRKLFGGEN